MFVDAPFIKQNDVLECCLVLTVYAASHSNKIRTGVFDDLPGAEGQYSFIGSSSVITPGLPSSSSWVANFDSDIGPLMTLLWRLWHQELPHAPTSPPSTQWLTFQCGNVTKKLRRSPSSPATYCWLQCQCHFTLDTMLTQLGVDL